MDETADVLQTQDAPEVLERAGFWERFAAFSTDLVVIVAFGTALSAVLGAAGVFPSDFEAFWLVLFVLLFLGYHSFLNAAGRRTFGKWLFGLRVYTREGKPLPLPVSIGRAFGYLLSNILCIGYLWALFNSDKAALHDRLAGTQVLETRPKSALGRLGVDFASLIFAAIYVGSAVWPIAAPYYDGMQRVADAKESLAALGRLEDAYKSKNGVYTGDMNALAAFYGDQAKFFSLLRRTVDLSTLRIDSDGARYSIEAQALDPTHAAVVYPAARD